MRFFNITTHYRLSIVKADYDDVTGRVWFSGLIGFDISKLVFKSFEIVTRIEDYRQRLIVGLKVLSIGWNSACYGLT